jgi:hypothetical protein
MPRRWRWGKAVEGHRTPRRWRESRSGPANAERLGVRQSSGALGTERERRRGGRGGIQSGWAGKFGREEALRRRCMLATDAHR